jgi:Ribbon-helix-helix protein, copG family
MTARRQSPPTGFRLTPYDLELLDRLAARLGENRTQALRLAVRALELRLEDAARRIDDDREPLAAA